MANDTCIFLRFYVGRIEKSPS